MRGEDPRSLLEAGVKGKARRKVPELPEALHVGRGHVSRETLTLIPGLPDAAEEAVTTLKARILETVRRDWEVPWTRPQTNPGIGAAAAAALMAEVGADMSQFGSARCRANRAGMCPGNRESAGKSRGGRRRKGNAYVRCILCEIAHAAARTRDTRFGPRKRALAARRGTGCAVVALGHKILRIAFAMLRDGVPYRDPVVDPEALTARKNLSRWPRMVR